MGCSPWGPLDVTEQLHFHFSLSCIGEGCGNPLQCSCLENPRDGGAWWAAIYGVTQSQTRLKQLSSSKDKKAFLSDQCKEEEENNRMGKTRDLFKKIRDTKGTFHAKLGSIKDRSGMRRGVKNTQKNCTKKIFTTQIARVQLQQPGIQPEGRDGVSRR